MKPQISIIIPVYNPGRYFKKCLDSVLAQKFHDYECILIDDGSTDGSGTVCDDYSKKDIRFKVIHQENRGISSARNEGLKYTRGGVYRFYRLR